jgi:hypothetical protein
VRRMANFNLSDYQTVQDRIDLFWKRFPQGRFNTEIISFTPEQVLVKAEVWTDWAEDSPRAVDYAEEKLTQTGVNRSSFVENAITSALGRAISQLGGNLSPKGLKPSREEMEKVERVSVAPTFLARADVLVSQNNVDGLRKLYVEAQNSGASPEVLKGIESRANGLAKSKDSEK